MSDPVGYSAIVWNQFRRRRIATFSLSVVLGLVALAVFAPVFASNKPFLWHTQLDGWNSPWLLSLFDRNFFESTLDLTFNASMVFGAPCVLMSLVGQRMQPWAGWRPLALTLWLVSTAAVLAFSGSQPKRVYPEIQRELEADGTDVFALYPVLPHSFRDIDLESVREAPSAEHWLGTDNAGRDVLTRLIYGTRISLTVGVFAVALYVALGTFLGALAGFFGGWVDLVVQRAIEVVLSIPSLFLILSVAAFIEDRSIFHVMLIIAAVQWTTPARLVRGEVLRLRNQEFVLAARASGYSESTIVFREVLPNAIGPVMVAATFGVAAAILIESTMSFLGLGDITVPSWGQLLSAGRTTGMWTLILAPGLAIFVTVSALNLLGDGLRDALDPKLRS